MRVVLLGSRGFVSQSAKMDPLEKVRRWKRSLDGYISFRKAVLIAMCAFAFILYAGPTIFSWLFPSSRSVDYFDPSYSCVNDKLGQIYADDLRRFDAHIRHDPPRAVGDVEDLLYVGNGHFGLADVTTNRGSWQDAHYFIRAGAQRVLKTAVRFKPVVKVSIDDVFSPVESLKSGNVLSYLTGTMHGVDCYLGHDADFSVEHQTYAHRTVPEILVQEISLTNPTTKSKLFNVERIGISGWDDVRSRNQRIEHGDGGQVYTVVTGTVEIQEPFSGFSNQSPFADSFIRKTRNKMYAVVSVVAPILDRTVLVNARASHKMVVVTSISHSQAIKADEAKDANKRKEVEDRAIQAVTRSLAMSSDVLRSQHRGVWKELWTTGFGISHSMAENAVNGRQINATMYYVLSQAPTPLHSLEEVSEAKRKELNNYLAYLEGCYGSLPTLHETKNLWRALTTLDGVNTVVQYWFLNLEVNGCHKLLRAGADGVVQAMVLSFAGLKFRQHHLELDADPKDLHRDYHMRKVMYGEGTRLNISVVLQSDNKAVIEVMLDSQNGDYFACDAGCLDPPVRLSSVEPRRFPVKLTDPVTAVLYVTSDYDHIIELKHTIHVKEVADAPAHEHHVIALHRHGHKLGGLPAIFWFSIVSLILIFHVFLFKLIWQEYCSSGPEKFRSRKFSDYR